MLIVFGRCHGRDAEKIRKVAHDAGMVGRRIRVITWRPWWNADVQQEEGSGFWEYIQAKRNLLYKSVVVEP